MPIGVIDLRDRQLLRDVERLHRLGPRVLYEFLAQLGAARLCRTEIEGRARRYAASLAALGIER
jgi:hypothetical protein